MSPSSWTSKTFRLAILAGCSFRAVDAVWRLAKFAFVKETEPHLVQAASGRAKVVHLPVMAPLILPLLRIRLRLFNLR